jgi:predicted TIM-barrel fold metal-dependent hydrolase
MIDIHTHPFVIEELVRDDPGLERAIHDVFGLYITPQPLDSFLLQMDVAEIDQAVLLPIDCTSTFGCCVVTNEQVAFLAERSPRFIGFASVDPHRKDAISILERSIKVLGLRGLKLDPSLQHFLPNDRSTAYPLYEVCSELQVPVLMHLGLSWAPRGSASFARPLFLEDVLQDFPKLPIIIAHFGWPWVEEALMLALKYPNAYVDTSITYSGTPSDALQHVLCQQIGCNVLERSLRNQILFGSNFPRAESIKRVRHAISQLGLTPALEHRILQDNAAQLLERGSALP